MELYQDPQQEHKEIEAITKKYALMRDAYKGSVDLRDTLNRLYDNEDFRKLILEGFMINHAVEQINNATTSNVALSQDELNSLMDSARASGHLSQYFRSIQKEAETMERSILNIDREELVEKEAVRQIYAEARGNINYD